MSGAEPPEAAAPPPGGLLDRVSDLLVPLVPGALVMVATVLLYQHAVERQLATMAAVCESEAGWVEQRLASRLDASAAAMERLAAERAEGGEAWRADAERLTQGALFRGVLEFDSLRLLRGGLPSEARELSAFDPRDDEARTAELRSAMNGLGLEAATVTTPALVSGGRQVLVCAPIRSVALRRGWLVGVVRLRDLLDLELARSVQRGFAVSVFEGVTLLYGARPDSAGPAVRLSSESLLLRGPLVWRIQVWPADELTRRLESWGPVGLFAAGSLLALFVAMTVYLWREQRLGSPGT